MTNRTRRITRADTNCESTGAGWAPLVSILTPSFNQGRFLRDCIASVAAQTYANVEQIVADGGSTDGTLTVLEGAPPFVRWQIEPDRGQAHALNKALVRASGEIVGWLNSDDALFGVDALEAVVSRFRSDPSIDVVYGDAVVLRGDGLVLRHHVAHWPGWERLYPEASPLVQPAVFVRRRALDALDEFVREDLHVALDLELWLRLGTAGARFEHLARVLAVDRDHAERKVRTLGALRRRENETLSQLYGTSFVHRPSDRAVAWWWRLRGAPDVCMWRRRYRPAFGWWTDSWPKRLMRQLVLPHSRQQSGIQRPR